MPHVYQPKPNSVPSRALELMRNDPGREWSTQELAQALSVGQTSMHGRLEDCLRQGLLRKELRNMGGRSITIWWLGNGTPPEHGAEAEQEPPTAFECALWNDGSLSITSTGGAQGVMPPEEVDQLAMYLARTWVPREAAEGAQGATP